MQSIVPKVYIVVPNRNGLFHLSYSLPLLLDTKYSDFHVVLVDDGSSDGSVDFVREKYPAVKLLENNSKRGFAATVNVGVRYAVANEADYIAIFNSDIKVPRLWLKHSVPVLCANDAIGLVGFKEILRTAVDDDFIPEVSHGLSYVETKRINGCLFIVRSTVFKAVGLFDEEYFMYSEDNDFFLRVIKAKFMTVTMPIPVWHYGEGSSASSPFIPVWLAYRNALRCSLKNEGFLGALRMIAVLGYHGCVPHLLPAERGTRPKRLRRYNPIINCFLLAGSIFWNIWHMPKTILARRHELRV